MSKTIRVFHAVRPASKPEDYILERPETLSAECRPMRIVKCPYGPLALWVDRKECKCAFCGGDGSLEIEGKDGSYDDVDCPKCGGQGAGYDYSESVGGIWSDADGNIIDPEMVQHDSVNHTISERWIAEWVKQKQAAA